MWYIYVIALIGGGILALRTLFGIIYVLVSYANSDFRKEIGTKKIKKTIKHQLWTPKNKEINRKRAYQCKMVKEFQKTTKRSY